MHLNSKKNATPVTAAMVNLLPHVKVKNHGFLTFASRTNPKVRLWGYITGSVAEKFLKKAEVEQLGTLPDGVVLITRKSGAVTRYVLAGGKIAA